MMTRMLPVTLQCRSTRTALGEPEASIHTRLSFSLEFDGAAIPHLRSWGAKRAVFFCVGFPNVVASDFAQVCVYAEYRGSS